MHPSTDSTVLAYKGLSGIPLWLLVGIAVIVLVAFAIRSRNGR
ncbi:hypothetical protein [Streptomyces sp. SID10815]|uniref:LPXTG cell wall anchor domain-containing protein n=1 Tax=Streptomyces similanensis TaxID=1274988 RepID=A0ABP9LL81_9ACTN|nr:hypothetical protein [Streptomyces sp. SID10815]